MIKMINRKFMIAVLNVLLFLFYAPPSFANISTDLNDFFNDLGFATNVTDANAYEGQQAGYYTGGSLFARSQVRNAQLGSVQWPKASAGCGGINLFTGGFSFVNSEELINMAKNVMNNAQGYAFHLALATISAMMESKLSFLNKWASNINRFNVNSCEMAAASVGSVWAKSDIASQHICETIGSSENKFYDRVRARHQCGVGGERSEILREFQDDETWREQISINKNIVWEALKKNSFLSSNSTLAEFFMSLSGSVIWVAKADEAMEQRLLPALGANRDLLNALLDGGKANIYQCDEKDRCLDPQIREVTITSANGLRTQVYTLLGEMVLSIRKDTALSGASLDFLNSTALPVFKLLMVELGYTQGQLFTDINRYADIISLDLLYQYLTENMQVIKQSARHLQIDEQALADLIDSINTTLATLSEQRIDTQLYINNINQLIGQSQALEQALAGRFSGHINDSFVWARGM